MTLVVGLGPGAGGIGARGGAENRAMTKKSEGGPTHPPLKPATRLATSGRDASANHGFVNPPVHHASTVLYPPAEDFPPRRARSPYPRPPPPPPPPPQTPPPPP